MSDSIKKATMQDPYAQMAKNTVDSRAQLKESHCVKLDRPDGRGVRVMFVGNSITLHGAKPDIGWHQEWGMAASAKEKDYVHLLENKILAIDPEASFCICQVASWERQYQEGESTHSLFEVARKFEADIIILRMVENVPKDGYDGITYKRELGALADYLNGTGNAALIATTGFWRHPADGDIRAFAKERGIPCVELGDLGEQDEMKAIGLFEHRGVANHPGDLGMEHIAERIMQALVESGSITK